jgi:hypothetical protein
MLYEYVGFVVEEVTLGKVFFKYFGFLCQFSFHRLLHTQLRSGAGTVGPTVSCIPSGLSYSPPQAIKKKFWKN